MPRPRKLYIHKTVVELCTSVQEGLPFVARAYMKFLINGSLAAAQRRFPITICHFIVMGNHIHIIAMVEDPADIPAFMDFFKTDLAHAVNQLFGWKGKSFWIAGYDSPIILSPQKLLDRMEYLYLNPSDADLSESIKSYEGLSSFNALLLGGTEEEHKRIARNKVPYIGEQALSKRLENRILNEMQEVSEEANILRISPWAWLECFEESKCWNPEVILRDFLSRLESKERELAVKRGKKNIRQQNQDPRRRFISRGRDGRRMVCLADTRAERASYLSIYKRLNSAARDAYQLFRAGATSLILPPGMFAPGGALRSNLMPNILWL